MATAVFARCEHRLRARRAARFLWLVAPDNRLCGCDRAGRGRSVESRCGRASLYAQLLIMRYKHWFTARISAHGRSFLCIRSHYDKKITHLGHCNLERMFYIMG